MNSTLHETKLHSRHLIQNMRLRTLKVFPVTLLFLISSFTAFAQIDDEKIKKKYPYVIINTDYTQAGKEAGFNAGKKRVYFDMFIHGYSQHGRSVSTSFKPPYHELSNMVLRELHFQGYRFTDEKHPPTQLITVSWGTLRHRGGDQLASATFLDFLGGYKLGLSADPRRSASGSMSPQMFIQNMMGGTHQKLLEAASKDLFFIMIASYDYDSATSGEGEPVLYWETRIATTIRGKRVSKAFLDMMEVAGPSIGKLMDKPEGARAPGIRAEIEMGELEFLGTEEDQID